MTPCTVSVFLLKLIFVRIVVIFWQADTGWHPANEEIREKSEPQQASRHTAQLHSYSSDWWRSLNLPGVDSSELTSSHLTAPAFTQLGTTKFAPLLLLVLNNSSVNQFDTTTCTTSWKNLVLGSTTAPSNVGTCIGSLGTTAATKNLKTIFCFCRDFFSPLCVTSVSVKKFSTECFQIWPSQLHPFDLAGVLGCPSR